MGFMKGYPGGEFRPNQPVTRAEVLVSLAQNLELPASESEPTPTQSSTVTSDASQPQYTDNWQNNRRPLLFPLAMTHFLLQ